jgi:NADPH2:quinone reductase
MPDLPETMTAITVSETGAADVLKPVTRPVPVPGEAEVLIEVAAAGINRGDTMQRMGTYPAPPGTVFDVLGLEVSGTIAAVGAGVGDLKVGDQVCALMARGGYAEYALADAPLVLPVPDGIDLVDAASLPETIFTVWTNVFDRGGLKPGERFLVHGGGSGIGTMAIQMAKAHGAEVFSTAGTSEKCAACKALGADHVINYRDTDFVTEIKDQTDGAGVDLILDMVAGDYLPRNLEALALEGRVVIIGLMDKPETTLNIVPILVKRLHVTGSTLMPRTVVQKAEIAQAVRRDVWPLFGTGQMKPVVHARIPLAEAVRAHELMEADTHIGKILLVT